MTSTYHLFGHGRLPWSDVRRLAEGLTCAWADLDGWHEGPAPDEAPISTHLWGWGRDRWLRARIDGDTAIVGELSLGGAGEVVTVAVRDGIPWGDDARIPARAAHAVSAPVTLLEVQGLSRVAFASRPSAG